MIEDFAFESGCEAGYAAGFIACFEMSVKVISAMNAVWIKNQGKRWLIDKFEAIAALDKVAEEVAK